MLYKGTHKARLYKGDAKSTELYKGEGKVCGYHTEEKNGAHIIFDDTYNGAFDRLDVFGKSAQKMYNGYNLALIDKTTMHNAYTSDLVSDDGNNNTITLSSNGNSWSGRGFVLPKPLTIGQKVYLKADVETEYAIYPIVTIEGWRNGGIERVTNVERAITSRYQELYIAAPSDGGTVDYYVIRFSTFHSAGSSVKGETITYKNVMLSTRNDVEFEPYVGGVASPNMFYPQAIEGMNLDVNVHGLNLAHDINIVVSQTRFHQLVCFEADLKPNTIYCLSFDSPNDGNQYYTNESLFNQVTMYGNGARQYAIVTTKETISKDNSLQYTNGRGWRILKNLIDEPSRPNLSKFMIVEGSSKNMYEPYREPQTPIPIVANGIKVAQNGNYTDGDGQMWYCDTIDFARGKYIQRIKHVPITLVKTIPYNTVYGYRWSKGNINDAAQVVSETGDMILCDKLIYNLMAGTGLSKEGEHDGIRMSGSFKAIVAEFKDDENNTADIDVAYMINPVEMDIDVAMRTIFPTTVIDGNTDRIEAAVKVAD